MALLFRRVCGAAGRNRTALFSKGSAQMFLR